MDEDEFSKFDPVEFELATGNRVRVSVGRFWEMLTEDQYRRMRELGNRPRRFLAIRIYSDEGVIPRRLVFFEEFRIEKEFMADGVEQAWAWLTETSTSRACLEYNELDEFIEEFAEVLDRCTAEGEDYAEHLRHFPAPMDVDREAFDPEDDSFYNDQRD